MKEKRLKYTTYVAGPIEATDSKTKKELIEAREYIWNHLNCKDLGIYDPIKMEAKKVGKDSQNQCEYIRGLKKGGHWKIFYNEMWKIWFGDVGDNDNIMSVLQNLRMRKFVDGNRRSEMVAWGDFEAVVRSDFILVHLPKIPTVGTHWEMLVAALFRIPVYLILPDSNKTEANSTMLFGVEKMSKGKTFYSINECIKYIKEEYEIQRKVER